MATNAKLLHKQTNYTFINTKAYATGSLIKGHKS